MSKKKDKEKKVAEAEEAMAAMIREADEMLDKKMMTESAEMIRRNYPDYWEIINLFMEGGLNAEDVRDRVSQSFQKNSYGTYRAHINSGLFTRIWYACRYLELEGAKASE
jgi:hypothetical protein